MKLTRLLHMPPQEILGRGRQEASKWLDYATARHRRPVVTGARGPVRDGLAARFFAGAAEPDTTAEALQPEWRERIIAAADLMCRNRFDLLGYRSLDFGDPVDWRLDPVSGRRSPLIHWSRLDLMDPAVVGDKKVIWELNRHQWLLHLGQAYRLTREERYAETGAREIAAWIEANPPGAGINWGSSLEVAVRLIAWCWALILLQDAPAFTDRLQMRMIAGIEAHARHIARYPSHYFAPNTHLTGEGLGLFYAGVLFPNLPRAGGWRDLGARILIAQCRRHILPDGVYFEHATCYQRYTAEFYLHFLILAARNRIAVPPEVADRVQRLLDFLVAVRAPNGSMPLIGDADGGWLLPLVPRAADDARGVLAVAAALFGRPDYAWAAGGPAPETLWLLGSAGQAAFHALVPASPAGPPSRWFPEGGYAVMRDRWGEDAHQLIVDAGPTSSNAGSHWHADLSSVQCAVAGEPYIVDPGTFTYADPVWREFFRSAAAHSTVRVDGRDHVPRTGLFQFDPHPRARRRRWVSTPAYDMVDVEHTLYGDLPDPVTHRRRVLFVKPQYWVVVDDLHGGAEHLVELGFQFAPIEVMLAPDLSCRARGRHGGELLVRPLATVPLLAAVHQGATDPLRGWYASDYGRCTPAPALVYTARARLPLRIATLLLPAPVPGSAVPAASPIDAGRRGLVGLTLNGETEIRFEDDDIVVRHALRS